jgi:hypothetical protein
VSSSGQIPARRSALPKIKRDDSQQSVSLTTRKQNLEIGSPKLRREDSLAKTQNSSDGERVTCELCGSRIRLADLPLHKRDHTKKGVKKTTSALGYPMKRRNSSKRMPFYREIQAGLPSLGKKR